MFNTFIYILMRQLTSIREKMFKIKAVLLLWASLPILEAPQTFLTSLSLHTWCEPPSPMQYLCGDTRGQQEPTESQNVSGLLQTRCCFQTAR